MNRLAYFCRTFLCALLGHKILSGVAPGNVLFRQGGAKPVPSYVCVRCRGCFPMARAVIR